MTIFGSVQIRLQTPSPWPWPSPSSSWASRPRFSQPSGEKGPGRCWISSRAGLLLSSAASSALPKSSSKIVSRYFVSPVDRKTGLSVPWLVYVERTIAQHPCVLGVSSIKSPSKISSPIEVTGFLCIRWDLDLDLMAHARKRPRKIRHDRDGFLNSVAIFSLASQAS